MGVQRSVSPSTPLFIRWYWCSPCDRSIVRRSHPLYPPRSAVRTRFPTWTKIQGTPRSNQLRHPFPSRETTTQKRMKTTPSSKTSTWVPQPGTSLFPTSVCKRTPETGSQSWITTATIAPGSGIRNTSWMGRREIGARICAGFVITGCLHVRFLSFFVPLRGGRNETDDFTI